MEVSKKEKKNSLAVSVYIFETIICQMIGGILGIPYISVLLMIGLFIYVCVHNNTFKFANVQSALCAFLIVFYILAISIIKNGFEHAGLYTIYFIVFGITALLIRTTKYNYYWVILYSLRISFVYEMVYFLILRKQLIYSNNYWSLQMGTAYAFLIPAVVSLIVIMHKNVFKFHRKQTIFAVFNLVISSYIILFDCGTRGAIVALAIGFVLIFISKSNSVKKIIIIVTVLIAAIMLFQNLERILIYSDNMLSSLGIKISAISKMMMWLKYDSLDNGRDILYEVAYKLFKQNPFLGHGVGYYEAVGHGIYAHNLFLQMLCEVGLIGTMVFMFLFIKDFFMSFISRKSRKQKEIIHSLFFIITIPMLLFSSVYWLLPSFWLYFWSLFENNKIQGRFRK